MPASPTAPMLLAFSAIALLVIAVTIGAVGVALFIAGWLLGWLS